MPYFFKRGYSCCILLHHIAVHSTERSKQFNVSSWFVCPPLPKTIAIPSLKLGAKKLLPRKRTALKDFKWLKLKSHYIKRFFGWWTFDICSTCSTCSTFSEWGSACWLRYFFHHKFCFNEKVVRGRERKRAREREKERERERKRKKKRKRKIKRNRDREREREEKKKKKKEKEKRKRKRRERKGCFCKRRFFLLLAPGSALKKFAAIVNPEIKPTKVNWTLSWPSAFEICGKTVL